MSNVCPSVRTSFRSHAGIYYRVRSPGKKKCIDVLSLSTPGSRPLSTLPLFSHFHFRPVSLSTIPFCSVTAHSLPLPCPIPHSLFVPSSSSPLPSSPFLVTSPCRSLPLHPSSSRILLPAPLPAALLSPSPRHLLNFLRDWIEWGN